MAIDYGPTVRVNLTAPGWIWTVQIGNLSPLTLEHTIALKHEVAGLFVHKHLAMN
jgi:hypothetical protein